MRSSRGEEDGSCPIADISENAMRKAPVISEAISFLNEAFPKSPLPGEEDIRSSFVHGRQEQDRILSQFNGRVWTEIPSSAFLEIYIETGLGEGAARYYLPGLLLRALEAASYQESIELADSVTYVLGPTSASVRETQGGLFSSYSKRQWRAIIAALDALSTKLRILNEEARSLRFDQSVTALENRTL